MCVCDRYHVDYAIVVCSRWRLYEQLMSWAHHDAGGDWVIYQFAVVTARSLSAVLSCYSGRLAFGRPLGRAVGSCDRYVCWIGCLMKKEIGFSTKKMTLTLFWLHCGLERLRPEIESGGFLFDL